MELFLIKKFKEHLKQILHISKEENEEGFSNQYDKMMNFCLKNNLKFISFILINHYINEISINRGLIEAIINGNQFKILNIIIPKLSRNKLRKLFIKDYIFDKLMNLFDNPELFLHGIFIFFNLRFQKYKKKYLEKVISKFENFIYLPDKLNVIAYSINPFQTCILISIIFLEMAKRSKINNLKLEELAIKFRLIFFF